MTGSGTLTTVMASEAAKLLDFNQKLDIPLLDNVVGSLYNGSVEQVSWAVYIC